MVNKNINKVNLIEKDCAPTRCNCAGAVGACVGVFSHESFHTLDNKTINSVINSINGIIDNFNVEHPAEAIQQKTYLEIWNNKND